MNSTSNFHPLPMIRRPLPTPILSASSTRKGRGLRRKFTKDEDARLKLLVQELGENAWPAVAERMVSRSSRQCRERYKNYLSDELENGPWTLEEEELLEEKYNKYSSRWTLISTFFPHRSDANVKNHWAFMQIQRKRRREMEEKEKNKSDSFIIDDFDIKPPDLDIEEQPHFTDFSLIGTDNMPEKIELLKWDETQNLPDKSDDDNFVFNLL